MRTRQRNTNVATVQLPVVRAGCGGIDVSVGAFSSINAQEIIGLSKTIMQNAAGFAFGLALGSLLPTKRAHGWAQRFHAAHR